MKEILFIFATFSELLKVTNTMYACIILVVNICQHKHLGFETERYLQLDQ